MVCHGELYRSRPAPARLTGFYLLISTGGVIGGILVGVVAPLVFLLYSELHLGLLSCVVLLAVVAWRDPDLTPFLRRRAGAGRGFRAVEIANRDEPGGATRESTWVVLSRSPAFFERLESVSLDARRAGLVRIRDADPAAYRAIRAWTDDYSNLFQILR